MNDVELDRIMYEHDEIKYMVSFNIEEIHELYYFEIAYSI